MPLAGGSQFNLQTYLVGSIAEAEGVGNSSQALNLQSLLQFAGGSGLGQIDEFYETTLSLAASGSLTLGLNGGGLVDPFGGAIAMLHVKFILLQVNPLVSAGVPAGGIILSPGSTNPCNLMLGGTTPTLIVAPGETLLQTNGNGVVPNAGWVVTPSTGMNIKLTNASSSQPAFGTLIIGGTST